MKALIFGAGGQLGRALQSVAPANVQIAALSRLMCDIADAKALRSVIESVAPDFVFNAAAYTAVDKAEEDKARAFLINGVAPGLIARHAHEAGARIIHVSTDFVFDGSGSRPYSPNDPVRPLSVYGKSKLQGEIAVAEADPQHLIVRTAWVYSAVGSNFVRTMLRLMRERPSVRVVDDQIGTPTWAASLAQSLWDLAMLNATGIHHFTDAGVASWYDFAVAVKEEASALAMLAGPVEVEPIAASVYPTAARRPSFSVLDKTATWPLLRNAPPHWRENLRRMLRELQELG